MARPDICPRQYCFHWVARGGRADLERDGLPWFYFSTLDSLAPGLHVEFLGECRRLWGTGDE